jgi:hypothetical protein
VLYFDNFVRLGYQERPFGDDQPFDRNIANDKELGVDGAAFGVDVPTREGRQILKPLRWNEIADFFGYLPDGALQECFASSRWPPNSDTFPGCGMPATSSRC